MNTIKSNTSTKHGYVYAVKSAIEHNRDNYWPHYFPAMSFHDDLVRAVVSRGFNIWLGYRSDEIKPVMLIHHNSRGNDYYEYISMKSYKIMQKYKAAGAS